MFSYRGHAKLFAVGELHALEGDEHDASRTATASATNENIISRLDETERGPSLLDQTASRGDHVHLPAAVQHHGGPVTMVASARPVNATTGVDNNGDGVHERSARRSTGTS